MDEDDKIKFKEVVQSYFLEEVAKRKQGFKYPGGQKIGSPYVICRYCHHKKVAISEEPKWHSRWYCGRGKFFIETHSYCDEWQLREDYETTILK